MLYQVSISGTGNSGIIPVDYRQRPFNITVRAIVPSTETATFTVYQTTDNVLGPVNTVVPTSISQVTTTATVVSPNHGLNTTDWIRVMYSGSTKLDGFYPVASVTDKNTFTYTVTSGSDTGGANTVYIPYRMVAITALSAKTATTDATIVAPVTGLLMNVSAHGGGTGNLIFEVLQGPSSA